MVCTLLKILVAISVSAPNALAETKKPNIVVVMADDIGLGDLSFYHRRRTQTEPAVATPNLDRLIAEGMRFSDAHSPASLCAPTRFAMLTGNYAYRNYTYAVWSPSARAGIDPDFTTSARIAKAGGYHTAFFGKWGLGGEWNRKPANFTAMDAGALHFGFDYALELASGIQNHPYAFYESKQWMPLKPDSVLKELDATQTGYSKARKLQTRGGMGDSNWDPAQVGPILAEKAVSYIENQAAASPHEPFFLYYCSQAVHIPHMPPEELDGVKIADSTPGLHGDMICELDVQVGMLVKALMRTEVYDNTLFIFTSDNGGLTFDKGMSKAGHATSNGYRGHKGSVYEGGHRVPFVAVWPGKIRPGAECHEPIVSHDIVATIASIAGQPLPTGQVMDAANLLPLFGGSTDGPLHKYLMHQGGKAPFYALREGDWKLVTENKGGGRDLEDVAPIALFNLRDNPFEDAASNLIAVPEQKERVEAMLAKYLQLRRGGAPTVAQVAPR